MRDLRVLELPPDFDPVDDPLPEVDPLPDLDDPVPEVVEPVPDEPDPVLVVPLPADVVAALPPDVPARSAAWIGAIDNRQRSSNCSTKDCVLAGSPDLRRDGRG
jgi:hypothetical protein